MNQRESKKGKFKNSRKIWKWRQNILKTMVYSKRGKVYNNQCQLPKSRKMQVMVMQTYNRKAEIETVMPQSQLKQKLVRPHLNKTSGVWWYMSMRIPGMLEV
jgi:hypothetical protein